SVINIILILSILLRVSIRFFIKNYKIGNTTLEVVKQMGFLFQYIWTPIAVFVVGYLLLRIMGKKAVAEMSSFDLLVTIVLGTTITEPIVTKRLGVASYFAIAIAVVYLLFS